MGFKLGLQSLFTKQNRDFEKKKYLWKIELESGLKSDKQTKSIIILLVSIELVVEI